MSVIQSLRQDLREAATLKLLSTSFIELSAIKMKASRDSLLQNKQFYEDIQHLYQSIKKGAHDEGLISEAVPGTTVSLALTSNKRFYGTQNSDIVKKFLADIAHTPGDAVMIGLTGKTYLANMSTPKPIDILLFENDLPSAKRDLCAPRPRQDL